MKTSDTALISASIVNVVATASLGQSINLPLLRKLKDVWYDPDHYRGRVAYFKNSSMQGRVCIFCSGKLISVGTKTERQALCELELTKEYLIGKKIISPTILEGKIQNIVVLANFGKSIDLGEMAKKPRVIYEPEQFSGAILKIDNQHRATALLFGSGKVVITGLKNSQVIDAILHEISVILES